MSEARLNTNLQVLEILRAYLVANPDIRFSQAIYNLNIVTDAPAGCYEDSFHARDWTDDYNLEPWDLLARLRPL